MVFGSVVDFKRPGSGKAWRWWNGLPSKPSRGSYLLAGRTLFASRVSIAPGTASRPPPVESEPARVYTALGLPARKMVDTGGHGSLPQGAGAGTERLEANFGLGSILYYERDVEAARIPSRSGPAHRSLLDPRPV